MNDPYSRGLVTRNVYFSRRQVRGRLCAVLQGTLRERGLSLIPQPSRAMKAGDVHELIVTDEAGARPGTRVDRVAYVGFVEIDEAGVVVEGDAVWIGGKRAGVVAGFDCTHIPNHLNIVVRADQLCSGREMGLAVEDEVVIFRDGANETREGPRAPAS